MINVIQFVRNYFLFNEIVIFNRNSNFFWIKKINNAQGQLYNKLGLDLPQPVFDY